MRDAILDEVTDAAGESTKTPRLQRALQEFDENFDAIGLVSFNWDHTRNKPLNVENCYLRGNRIPQSKSTIIKNKYTIRDLAGQEKMCRLSGMAQRITPQLLQLQRDQDMHRVLKVALQPWPTLAGMKSSIDFGTKNETGETYFRADNFCKMHHDNMGYRREIRRQVLIVPNLKVMAPLCQSVSQDSCRTELWLGLWFIQFIVKVVAQMKMVLLSEAPSRC